MPQKSKVKFASLAEERRAIQKYIKFLEGQVLRRGGLLTEVLIVGAGDWLPPKLAERIRAEIGPVSGGEG